MWTCGPSFFSGEEFDPFFASVFSLSDHSGALNQTTLTDIIPARAWTSVNNARLDTAQFKFPPTSTISTLNAYWRETNGTVWDIDSGAKTYEIWARPTNSTVSKYILSNRNNTSGLVGWELLFNSSAGLTMVGIGASFVITANSIYAQDTWYHVAMVASGGRWTILLDGICRATSTTFLVAAGGATYFRICSRDGDAFPWNGHVGPHRFTAADRYGIGAIGGGPSVGVQYFDVPTAQFPHQ